MSHPAAYQSENRSGIEFWAPSSPVFENSSYERVQIVRKIRTLDNYLGIVTRMTDGVANYVVGSGISPIPSTKDEEFNKRVSAAWKEWALNAKVCDRAGKHTFHDKQREAIRGYMSDGEAFQILQKTKSGIPQLLGVDPLLVGDSIFNTEKDVVDGVKIDAFGKHVKYFINSLGDANNRFASKQTAVMAKNVIHFFKAKRLNATRGQTPLHSAANSLHDILDHIALEKQATKAHQSFAIHVKKKDKGALTFENALDNHDEDILLGEGAEAPVKKDGVSQIRGGSIVEDDDIDDINFLESSRPSLQLIPFAEFIIRDAAMATGFPYEFLWNISGIGGAPSRFVLADAYVTIKALQNRLETQHDFPIYRWWLASQLKLHRDSGGTRGVAPPEGDDQWYRVQWRRPTKVTMDIKNDGKLYKELIACGLGTEEDFFEDAGISRSEIVDKRIAEIVEVKQKCEDAEIPMELYYQQLLAKTPGGGLNQEEETEENKKTEPKK